eukprot:9374990-Pyramimonas_sp.AAC.1
MLQADVAAAASAPLRRSEEALHRKAEAEEQAQERHEACKLETALAAKQVLKAKEQLRSTHEVLAVKAQLLPPAHADAIKAEATGTIMHMSSFLEKPDGASFVDADFLDLEG